MRLAILVLFAASSGFAQQLDWRSIGPPGGNVISMAASPEGFVYLGAADGHIFFSQDGGASWSLRGRVSGRHDAVIQCLLADARRPGVLFAAVWFQDVQAGGALYRSNDGGVHWAVAGLPGEIVRAIQQSPSAPEILVAGTRSGIFRSVNSGESWERISPAGDPELRNVDSVAIDPGNPQIVYAGTYHLPWKTLDAGQTWQPVAAGMIDDSDVMSLRVDGTQHDRVFASACSGIYRSENGAARWTKLQGIPYSSRRTQAIVQDPRDARILYAATTEGLWVTRDGGESWNRTTPRDWVVNDLVVLPATPAVGGSEVAKARILIGTEAQGILLSTDEALTFTPANNGFSHRVAAGLVADPRASAHLLAWLPGLPDALLESGDAGQTWHPLPDHTSPGVGPSDVGRIFSSENGWWAATAQGALFSYDPGAARWSAWRFDGTAPPMLRTRPAQHRAQHAARAALPPAISGPSAAFPKSPVDILEIHTLGARVFVATTETLWGGDLSAATLHPVAVSPVTGSATDDTARAWIVAGGKILSSADDGKSWNANNITLPAGMRGTDLRWIRPAPVSAGPLRISDTSAALAAPLLVATTTGLYRVAALGQPWQLVQRGLPAAEPVTGFLDTRVCLLATRTGGLYLSRDGAETWERLDLGRESGLFTGAALLSDGGIVAAALTEGLLWLPPGQVP